LRCRVHSKSIDHRLDLRSLVSPRERRDIHTRG
jgi:hypothetical protein